MKIESSKRDRTIRGLRSAHLRQMGRRQKKKPRVDPRGLFEVVPTRRWAQIPNGRLCFLSKLKREAIVPTIAAPIFGYCCVGFTGV